MTFCCFVFITVTLSLLACAASLKCFNCTGVTHMDDCQNKTKCGKNEVCFTQRQYSGQISYDLGCIDSKKCGNVASLPSGISRIDTSQENTNPCFECCSRKNCNSQLCQYKDPDVCVDDAKVNCAFLNSLFNLCEDINQAKKICPKYCKLCQFVDGNWTPWSNWSDCNVTCENGTQIRTRDNDTETKSCHRGPCPIHGGWNTWSTWSECSVSCDIGMQHRDRSCTNPKPSPFGDHCFENSREDRICMPGACADGGWSTWGSWGTCSVSCSGGIMSRNRACSNPVPSMTGKQCIGNSEQVSLCNKQACKDGGWSAWGRWGTCSVSCSGGTMSRNRACTNPAPSMTGKQCMGNSEQVSLCNKQACKDGGWSAWGSWGKCSKSCEGGIMSRNRACSNPAPSMTGKQCMGNSEQVSLCNKQSCKDGGWSSWGRWGTCSKSCAGGTMSRNRACSNPAPSMTGKQCLGNSEQVSLCNQQACQEYNVAFTAYSVHRNSSLWTTLLFQNTYTNYGSGYSTTTGKFTCKVPGVYHFVVTLMKHYQDIDQVEAYLRINGSKLLRLYVNPDDDGSNEVGSYMMTGAGTFHIDKNDVVDVEGVPNNLSGHGHDSYFTGFLITPDQ